MKRLLVLLAFLISSCVTNVYHVKPNIPDNPLAYKSVALLYIKSPNGRGTVATGFAYDEDRIITAGHFCISALEIQIFESHKQDINMKYYDHNMDLKTKHNLEIEDISRTEDLCVLKKKGHSLIPLNMVKEYKNVKVGDSITVVGVPAGTAVGEFYGKVMSPVYYGFGPITVKGSMLISAASMGGISGSPIILDRTGEVIGVVVRGDRFFDHLTFGINGYRLNEFIKGFE